MALYGEGGLITYIKTQLEAVSGIGLVHDYDRIVNESFDLLKSLYTDPATGKINGWTITRTSTEENIYDSANNERIYNLVIKGFYQHEDAIASEKDFQNLIEAIVDKLRTTETYGNFAFRWPPVINTVDTLIFGNFLVHHCEITLRVEEIKFVG